MQVQGTPWNGPVSSAQKKDHLELSVGTSGQGKGAAQPWGTVRFTVSLIATDSVWPSELEIVHVNASVPNLVFAALRASSLRTLYIRCRRWPSATTDDRHVPSVAYVDWMGRVWMSHVCARPDRIRICVWHLALQICFGSNSGNSGGRAREHAHARENRVTGVGGARRQMGLGVGRSGFRARNR